MNIILLSGGSGKRLWPLSNDIRSKQFIKLFKDDNGNYESMVQRVYRQITTVNPMVKVTVATSKNQVSVIKSQLGEKINICVEPSRRDTFPAILLAAFVGWLTRKGLISSMSNVTPNATADNYIDTNSFSVTKSNDQYMYQYVTVVPKPKNNNRGGGGITFNSSDGGHGGGGGRY